MKIRMLSLALPLATASLMSMNVSAAPITDDGNTKSVGSAVWHTQANLNAQQLLNAHIPNDRTSLFFIRKMDDDPIQTSANIAVNDRFHVSLHPGSYSQVYSCAGDNAISVNVTGAKMNDLLHHANEFNLAPNGKYFFYIDVEPSGQVQLLQISESSALPLLEGKTYQNHQISRVVLDSCPETQIPPAFVTPPVVVTPPPVIIETLPVAPPVLEEKVRIELEVLFANDEDFINPMYYSEIREVANFMQQYSNTTAIIEGHTDSNGRQNYNQGLSERRALAVMDMLTNRYGINPNRLSYVGYGESRPVATNATANGRQQNRRVIAIIEER